MIPQSDTDDDELFCTDIQQLTPTQFLHKYMPFTNIDFTQIPTEVLCYIILVYLDWRTVFKSCLLVNKDFFRKIANNRILFINLYNELFVMDQKDISQLTWLHESKHKKIKNHYYWSRRMYGGLGVPLDHYHFCSDYEDSFEVPTELFDLKASLSLFHRKTMLMSDQKLMLIKRKWEEAVSAFRAKKNQVKKQTKQEENKVLLTLIKKIIKDKLFMRKYFNNELKSIYLGQRRNETPMKDIEKHILDLFYEVDESLADYEEVVLGSLGYRSTAVSHFVKLMDSNYNGFGNILSIFASKLMW